MAVLPTPEMLGERPTPLPSTSIAVAQTGFEAQATAQLGQAIEKIGSTIQEARRSSQLVDAMGKATEALGTKEIEFQRDQDFATAPSRFKQAANQIGQTAALAIDDPLGRQAFQREYTKLAVSKQLSVVQSAAKQEADYNHAQLTTSLDNIATSAANAGNSAERKILLDQAKMAIGEMRGGNGRPGWITDVQAKALGDRFMVNYFDAWRVRDPVGALNEFVTNRAQMRPDLAMQLEQHLFVAAAPVLASQLNLSGGAGVVKPEQVPSGMPGGADLPRGVRNNNPGNIVRTSTQWDGEIAGNDPRYSSFATPEAGIRALGKNLVAYQEQHGLNTVGAIVARWAPATENDTATYIDSVSKAVGVAPDQAIDVKDPAVLGKLTKAIITTENGKQPYSDQQVKDGVAAALGAKLPSSAAAAERSALRDPSIPTGNALIDALPADQKMHVLQLARAQGREEQHAARQELKGRLVDTEAAYLSTGAAPNAPGDNEILAAFGQTEGPPLIRRLRDVQQTGQNIQQVKTLPDKDIEGLVLSSKPQPGDGYAQRMNDWKLLAEAADRVREARRSDPVGFAAAAGAYGVKPIPNLADPEAVAAELTQRGRSVVDMARDYGTAPALLSKPEAQALAGALKGSPVEIQKTYLATLFNGVGQDMSLFKVAMKQVAPDAPVLAVAGIYQGRALRTPEIASGFFSQGRPSGDVADLILRGNAILHPVKKEDGANHEGGASLIKMPDEKLMLADWVSKTGEAFKGKEQANDLFQQVAKSIYASLSAEKGDYSGVYDAKRWKQAIDFSTGGIERHNGAEVVLPYGWTYDQFKDGMKSRLEPLVKDQKPLGVTASDLASLPVENVGDGRYIFRRGTGYIVDKNGAPFTVTFTGDRPAPFSPSAEEAPPPNIPNPGGFAVTGKGAVTGIPRGRK